MAAEVSVIIPVYNGDRFLSEAMASVVVQTYKDWELILVDDGSRDDSTAVIQRFIQEYGGSCPIRYISQANQGVSVARNQGVAAATGKYIAFLDQDDWFLPDKLALQVAHLDRQPELAMVSSGWRIVDQVGVGITAVQPWLSSTTLNLQTWVRWKPVFLGAMVFRKDWLIRSGFDPQWQQTGDVAIVLEIAKMGGLADWTKQATVNYRQHSQNVSRNVVQQAEELQQVLDQFFASDLPPEVRRLEQPSRYQSLVWSAWRSQHCEDLATMAQLLQRSRVYSDQPATAMLLDWMDQFQSYSKEYGCEIDLGMLTRSPEWMNLVNSTLSL
jgi:hypothetical protein